MANASRVAEIFEQASTAFGRLAQLTIDLKLAKAQLIESEKKQTDSKWSEREIDLLKEALVRFGDDLSKIAEAVETKSLNQIKQQIKLQSVQIQDSRRRLPSGDGMPLQSKRMRLEPSDARLSPNEAAIQGTTKLDQDTKSQIDRQGQHQPIPKLTLPFRSSSGQLVESKSRPVTKPVAIVTSQNDDEVDDDDDEPESRYEELDESDGDSQADAYEDYDDEDANSNQDDDRSYEAAQLVFHDNVDDDPDYQE